ncbi:hypothetical protein GCM10027321_18660 [Massilia terrae]|uniref:Lipoprotein n=1 Tax=Massilia terrae TaxID=1811224 RepID=A0ABT2CWJ0_9BURK|nr:hypothetical protein [Massilia terrae]MCS0658327.1 hypothetical protein [Massilia terrae]
MQVKPMAVVLAALLIAACSKHAEDMGPAQRAGKAVDDAGEKVAAQLHEPIDKASEAAKSLQQSAGQAQDQIKEATAEVGKKVEQAGEKIQDAAK